MITSKDNELVKHIRSLSQKKYRDEYGEYIVEGSKMVFEALEYADVKVIIICEKLFTEKMPKTNTKIEYVSEAVFKHISDTMSPQGIMAVISKKERVNLKNSIKLFKKDKTIFALDKVQDPGNLGTIIRTLDAAGIKHLIVSKDSADVYNPKVIRSTMGAIFRLNIFTLDMELFDALESLREDGIKVVVSSLDTKKYFYDIDFDESIVIVIGNESQGVSKEVQNIADYKVKIPMKGKTESLNASVAASIIAYEKVRREI